MEVLDKRRIRKVCPNCMTRTYREYGSDVEKCPDCKRQLKYICRWNDGEAYNGCGCMIPEDYFDVPTRIIALAGAKATGKSQFLSVLMHRMGTGTICGNIGLGFLYADAMTKKKVKANKEELAQKKTVQETNPDYLDNSNDDPLNESLEKANSHAYRQSNAKSAANVSDPYIFLVSRSVVNGRKREERKEYLILFDTAGESLEKEEKRGRIPEYMAAADAVLFFVDPLQIPAVRDRIKIPENIKLPPEEATERNSWVFDTVVDMVGSKTRFCLVLTKVDMLIKDPATDEEAEILFPPSSPVRRSDAVDYSEIDAISDFVKWYLMQEELETGNMVRVLEGSFANRHKFFALSSLGHAPSGNKIEIKPDPIRIDDPLSWVLRETGSTLLSKGR